MLRKINRLSKQSDFEEVKKENQMLSSPLFGLLYLSKNKSESVKKFGFVVSKRISKKAVERNRIKRLLAQSVKNNLNKFPEGFWAIFLVTKQMLGKKYGQVEENLLRVVKLIK